MSMYKTCSICNRIHDININCKRPYRYKKNVALIDLEARMNGNKKEKRLRKEIDTCV